MLVHTSRRLVVVLAFTALACRSSNQARTPAGTTRDTRLAGVSIHTVSLGDRRGAIRYVLHGGPGLDHTYLRPWLDPLARDATLVYVDLRGHGHSSSPPDADGYTIAAAADDLAALAHARGDGPVDVIAHDFGAAVAVSFATRHPEALRRLVLVDPLRDAVQVRSVGERSRAALGPTGWQRIQSLTTSQGTLRDARSLPALFRGLGTMWWHTPPSESVITGMTRSMVYREESDANFMQAVLRWDARIAAPEVRAPALVISGESDRTFLPSESRALAEMLPHGRFLSIARAGHLPFVEQQEAFLQGVVRFLAR